MIVGAIVAAAGSGSDDLRRAAGMEGRRSNGRPKREDSA